MKLILGTAQMGLDYGINNSVGKISVEESHKILFEAFSSGITILDTAEAYGNAHQVIGAYHKNFPAHKFQIITKIPHNIDSNSFEIKIKEYIKDLYVNCLEVLMFHSFDSFVNSKKNIDVLVDLKCKGHIKHIGVSVYTNEQLDFLLREDEISVVQLPFNLLDNINTRGRLIQQLKAKGKIIHSRSVFLQGLFFKNLNINNKIVQKLNSQLEVLKEITIQSNCSMEELALGYCLKQNDIDKVLIGVDSILHLDANLKASTYSLSDKTIKTINTIKVEDLDLLNPSLW
jgi:aryl-alcohol dehydrogenase-like predicted oxidoreductase